jgi:hypothetical protein
MLNLVALPGLVFRPRIRRVFKSLSPAVAPQVFGATLPFPRIRARSAAFMPLHLTPVNTRR